MPFNRSLAEVLNAHGDTLRNEMRKCLPAVVVKVHPERQTVDVQITVKNPIFTEFEEVVYQDQPSIADVPVGVLRGGGFFVWIPVQVGDSVMLIFSDLSTDTWRASDGAKPVNPGWAGKHTIDSPFAIPWIAPDTKFLVDPSDEPNKLIIGKDGTNAQMRISASQVEFGPHPTDAAGLASKIDSAVSTIVAAFNSHTHPSPPAPVNPVVTGPPTTPISAQPSTASVLVKIKS